MKSLWISFKIGIESIQRSIGCNYFDIPKLRADKRYRISRRLEHRMKFPAFSIFLKLFFPLQFSSQFFFTFFFTIFLHIFSQFFYIFHLIAMHIRCMKKLANSSHRFLPTEWIAYIANDFALHFEFMYETFTSSKWNLHLNVSCAHMLKFPEWITCCLQLNSIMQSLLKHIFKCNPSTTFNRMKRKKNEKIMIAICAIW